MSVVVPGLDCATTLRSCLSAIIGSSLTPDELLFFDDGSVDGSGDLARSVGARVMRNDGAPLGPGMARNRAAAIARGDVLVFVDADVVVHVDAIARLVHAIEGRRDGGTVAAFGSYDDRPPARNIASLYMNLRHHAVHQQGNSRATTFWAGLGAIRRDAFVDAGGFSSRYGRPSIEDIELGTRLIAAGGRIRLIRDAQGTHHKRWSLMRVWRTDIFHRAIPWSRLIAERGVPAVDLNAAPQERRAAILAHLAPVLWAGAFAYPPLLVSAAVASAAYLAQNRRLFAVMRRRVPAHLLPAIALMHWTYHIYASQIFGWTLLIQKRRRRSRATD